MVGLFFVFCVISIILQINLIVKLKKTADYKYWHLFLSVNIISLLSVIIADLVFMETLKGFNSTIFALFTCGSAFVTNLILYFIGKKISKSVKKVNLDLRSLSLSGIILLLNIVIFIITPFLINVFINISIENSVVKYLNNKYGNNDFEVFNIEKDYTSSGIIDSYHTGYVITVYSKPLNKSFEVRTGKNFTDYKDYKDAFLDVFKDNYEKYRENLLEEINIKVEKLQNYLKRYSKISLEKVKGFDLDSAFGKIPNNYGKVPTVKELCELAEDYVLNHSLCITFDIDDIYYKLDSTEKIDYYIEIANYIIEYYSDIDSFNIECWYHGKDYRSKSSEIIIDSDNIYIKIFKERDHTGKIEKTIKREK